MILQRLTTNVRFTYNLGNTTHAVYNQYQARQIELVTLNAIFSEHPGTCKDAIDSLYESPEISINIRLESNL